MFSGCTALKWAILPADNTASSYVHTVPDYMFYNCTSLESVWVGSGYTSIAANAFRGCTGLKSVVWTGNSISSIGSNFPTGAKLAGKSSIQSWCSSNSKSFVNIEGSCSGTLAYSYDLSDRTLTLTGSGEMQTAPWTVWRYFIYGLDLGTPSGICQNAFAGCEYLDGEITIPNSVEQIDSGAFLGAGYGYYIINSESVNIASTAFGEKSNIVFYGKRNSGAYAYVQSKRTEYPGWKYYCTQPHDYSGFDSKCLYCDKVRNMLSLEPLGNHSFVYQYRTGNNLYFRCDDCGISDCRINVRDLLLDFENAVSFEAAAYHQSNYDGRFDILRDGYVNAKDYKILLDVLRGNKTEYDMTLSNENATVQAKKLYANISGLYKDKIISGQQESTWIDGPEYEMNYIYNNTGKYPAMRGLDFMGDDFYGVVNRAKAWAARGGIVTICWHCSSAFDQSYDACKADELTPEQWEAVLTDGTDENEAFLAAMDKAGNALLELQDEGIPVLWRPFHEFDGGWFWWGKGGSEYFKRLWIMMYEHFTYDLGLNNLIWVLGYSHNGTDYGTNLADWYPGSRYCDIVGADSYEVAQNGAEARLYNPVHKIVGDSKPMAMHETGKIPTVEQFGTVPWVFFMTWHTNYLTDENPSQTLSDIYNSSYVITLDELSDFYN
jgi:beta-mannanase